MGCRAVGFEFRVSGPTFCVQGLEFQGEGSRLVQGVGYG